MESFVEQLLPEIRKLLLHYGVERAYLFGSAARGTMNKDSDVDFIIRFPETMHFTTYADNYFAFAENLETLLQRKLDLVTEKTLKNIYLLDVINQNKLQLV